MADKKYINQIILTFLSRTIYSNVKLSLGTMWDSRLKILNWSVFLRHNSLAQLTKLIMHIYALNMISRFFAAGWSSELFHKTPRLILRTKS